MATTGAWQHRPCRLLRWAIAGNEAIRSVIRSMPAAAPCTLRAISAVVPLCSSAAAAIVVWCSVTRSTTVPMSSTAVVALVDFAINVAMLAALMVWYGFMPTWRMLLFMTYKTEHMPFPFHKLGPDPDPD